MNATSVLISFGGAIAAFGLGWFVATTQIAADPSSSGSPLQGEALATELESILHVKDPQDRAQRLADFFAVADPKAALSLRETIRSGKSELKVDEITEILFARWWAGSDPESAFQNPINPSYSERHPWMRTVVLEWARQDPVAAATAVQKMPAGQALGRIEGARAIVDEWSSLEPMPEPDALFGVIAQLEPLARGGAIKHFVESMMTARGIDAALGFVRNIPADNAALGASIQQEFISRTAVALVNHDIDRAVAWAHEQRSGPNAIGVAKHLAYYWGLRDGQAAIEWAFSRPDGPGKSAVIKRAWLSFSRKQKEQAGKWLTSRPPHPLMKGTYSDFIRKLAETEPENAIELANRAVDADLRDLLKSAAGVGWMKNDRGAALAWLAKADLPPDLEQKVRSAKAVAGP